MPFTYPNSPGPGTARSAYTTWSDLPKDQWPDWMNTPTEQDFASNPRYKELAPYQAWAKSQGLSVPVNASGGAKSGGAYAGVAGAFSPATSTSSSNGVPTGLASASAGGASAGLKADGTPGENDMWTTRNVKDPTRQTALDNALSGLADSTTKYGSLFDSLQSENDTSRANQRKALDQENASINDVFSGGLTAKLDQILAEKTKAVGDIANTMRAKAAGQDAQRGMLVGGGGSSYRDRILNSALTNLYQNEADQAANSKLSNLQYVQGLQSSLLGARQRGESALINQGGAVAQMRSPIEQALANMLNQNVAASNANNFYGVAGPNKYSILPYTGGVPSYGGSRGSANPYTLTGTNSSAYPAASRVATSSSNGGMSSIPSRLQDQWNSLGQYTPTGASSSNVYDQFGYGGEFRYLPNGPLNPGSAAVTPSISNVYDQFGYGGEFGYLPNGPSQQPAVSNGYDQFGWPTQDTYGTSNPETNPDVQVPFYPPTPNYASGNATGVIPSLVNPVLDRLYNPANWTNPNNQSGFQTSNPAPGSGLENMYNYWWGGGN